MNHAGTKVRVRFAPSPTGHLHIGSLRTALFNWLFARHHNGVFLMRIEDTDLQRSKEEYTQSILQSLEWVNIQPDEPIVIQSQRIKEHTKVVSQLLEMGAAYKCYCTEQELKDLAGDNAFSVYDNTCRNRTDHPNKPYAVRFKIPDITELAFDDIVRGRVVFAREQLYDFIIARSDGNPMYNFVVVVDDHAMEVTHVIRGEDHISNTPKQILLYKALGYQVPQFAHIPLILGPSGDRLSKRDGATSAMEYKRLGYLPDALVNYLVRLGWAHGDQEIFTRAELVQFFNLDAVGKKGSIFDVVKLQWVNGVYLRAMSEQDIISYIEKELDPLFRSLFSDWDDEQLWYAIRLYKERVATLNDLIVELQVLYRGPQAYDAADIEKWVSSETSLSLERVINLLEQSDSFTHDALAEAVKEVAKELGVKMVIIAQPVRIALIGKSNGPGVFDMLALLKKKESIARIRALVQSV